MAHQPADSRAHRLCSLSFFLSSSMSRFLSLLPSLSFSPTLPVVLSGGRPPILVLRPGHPGCSLLDGHGAKGQEEGSYRRDSSLPNGCALCLYPYQLQPVDLLTVETHTKKNAVVHPRSQLPVFYSKNKSIKIVMMMIIIMIIVPFNGYRFSHFHPKLIPKHISINLGKSSHLHPI